MPDNNFFKAESYLKSLGYRGMKLGLDNITSLLGALGNPHRHIIVIHVAGTNGKGSTCSMISSILSEAGISNGLYTSPHVETFRERIQVDGNMIGETEAADLVWSITDSISKKNDILPTYFEFMTAMALCHFERKGCSVAVMEVGLGGRFDSTNIVNTHVSVITSIDLDHAEHLGGDLVSIAFEKSGIIKPTRPVVISVQDNLARERIVERAKELHAPTSIMGKNFSYQRQKIGNYYETLDFISDDIQLDETKISLCGSMQPSNAATAIQAVNTLQEYGIKIREDSIRSGLQKVPTNSRFEIISTNPLVILDGAHNPAAAYALSQTLTERFGLQSVDFVFGAMADKDYPQMLHNLAPVALSFTMFSPKVPRAEDPSKLARAQKVASIPTQAITFCNEVVDTIMNSNPKSIWVITGSFYTLGELKPALRKYFSCEPDTSNHNTTISV